MDQPDTVQIGPDRPPLRDRLTERHRRRVVLLVVFVIGAVLGSAVVSGLSPAAPAGSPDLRIAVADVVPFGTDGELSVELRVHNFGAEQVQIDRMSAEANGFGLVYAAPRPPDGGPPLRIEPSSTGTVELTLRPYCRSSGSRNATLLLVLAGDGAAARTVALPVPELNRRLAAEHRASCALSGRPGDYTVALLKSRSPAWADGRLLVVAVRVRAHGALARGVDLVEVRPNLAGVGAHFVPRHREGPESLSDGSTGELWLRMRDCRRATGLDWGRAWPAYPNGVGIGLYVEKPGTGAVVPTERNERLLTRIHRWAAAACAGR